MSLPVCILWVYRTNKAVREQIDSIMGPRMSWKPLSANDVGHTLVWAALPSDGCTTVP